MVALSKLFDKKWKFWLTDSPFLNERTDLPNYFDKNQFAIDDINKKFLKATTWTDFSRIQTKDQIVRPSKRIRFLRFARVRAHARRY